MILWGVGILFVLGLIGQACEDDPSGGSGGYEPSPSCASAARAQEANGFDYDSEYEACRKIEAIVGD